MLLAPVFATALRRPLVLAVVGVWLAVVVGSVGMYPDNTGLVGTSGVLIRSLTLLPMLVLVGYAAGRDRHTTDDVLAGLLGAALLVAGLFLIGGIRGAGHIEAGRIIAVGIPVLALGSRAFNTQRPTRWASAGLLLLAALLTGARAPLVFGILSWVLCVVLARRGARRATLQPLLIASLCVVAVSLVVLPRLTALDASDPTSAVARQSQLLSARSLADLPSGEDRIENYYTPAIERISERLLTGWGWPADVSDDDGYQYAHNILLEFGVAFGLAGLVLVFSVLVLLIRFIVVRGPDRPALAGVIAFVLMNALVSGDLVVNRYILFAVSAVLGDRALAAHRPSLVSGVRR